MRISISDNGYGIEPSRQSELFESFNRLGAETGTIEGTGIGLVITKKLTEMMGGKIGLESVVDEGSTFWVELPSTQEVSSDDEMHNKSMSGQVMEERDGIIRHLLYIEDNPSNQHLVGQIVSLRNDWHLLHASSAELGLDIAMVQHPDLILMDINLGGMNGYEALNRLKEHEETRAIPVIAVSANAMQEDVERAREAGFDDYLTKPINVKGFLETIDRVLTA